MSLTKPDQPDAAKHINYHVSRPGIGHMPSYLVSGTPFMTGCATLNPSTTAKVEFPRIAREVVVTNRSAQVLRISFRDKDTKGNVHTGLHYVTLQSSGASYVFRCKTKEIYIYNENGSSAGAFELYAELTNINSTEMYELTGSGITE